MDFYASPALLGAIIACVAVCAWTLGRWQSGTEPLADGRMMVPVALHPPFEWRAAQSAADHAVASPSGETARADRQIDLDCGLSLGELHAEVSAYRRQQQVFAAVAQDGLQFERITAAVPRDFRPATRPAEGVNRQQACGCDTTCTLASSPLEAARVAQPSAGASDLIRV